MVHHLLSHPVSLTKTQLKSLSLGGAINLKPHHFVEQALHHLEVLPQTANRIANHLAKNKGLRIQLKPKEDISEVTEGGKISLKSVGDAFKHFGDKVASSAKQTFSPAGGRQIASTLIHQGIPDVAKALGAAAGDVVGGPVGGIAGGVAANMGGKELANYVGNKTGLGLKRRGRPRKVAGQGVFSTIKKVFGINRGDAVKSAKTAAKAAAAAGGVAVGAYTGNPMLGTAFSAAAERAADHILDSAAAGKTIQEMGADSKAIAKDVAIGGVDSYLNQRFPGESKEKKYIQNAMVGKYPQYQELISDYVPAQHQAAAHSLHNVVTNSTPSTAASTLGYGIKPKKIRKRGGAVAVASPPYQEAMTSIGTINGGALPNNVKPYTGLMTLSPYAAIHSPQMNPTHFPSYYQTPKKIGNGMTIQHHHHHHHHKIGGSFLASGSGIYPAGSFGNGIYPAGTF